MEPTPVLLRLAAAGTGSGTATLAPTPAFLHRSRISTTGMPLDDRRSRTLAPPAGGADERALDDGVAVLQADHATATVTPLTQTPTFESFYAREYDSMVRVAFLIVGSTETAEELVQDSFVRVHQRWSSLDNHRAYLRTTVVNGCRDRIRRRIRLRARVPLLAADAQLAATVDAPGGDRPDLVEALRRLPVRQRSALVLRYYGGFTESEIAEALGVQRGTVKSLVHRGLEQLRHEITPEHETEPETKTETETER